MKILAAGDIHGDLFLSQKLAKKAIAEQVDMVILCGDISQMEQNAENAIQPFIDLNIKTMFVPGNHETFATADFISELFSIKNLHTESHIEKDIGIFGCGGANIGLFQLTEQEIHTQLKTNHESIKHLPKKIMVTHVHPTNSNIEEFTQFFPGSTGVRKAIEEFEPDYALCSHVHEAEGIEDQIGKTKLICVGREGKIFDI